MPNNTWKHTERAIAKRLGGRRIGATGRATADVVSNSFSVEVKHRRRLPQWVKDAVEQARHGAGERLPIVILHESGQRHADDLVVLKLSSFQEWFGEVTREN